MRAFLFQYRMDFIGPGEHANDFNFEIHTTISKNNQMLSAIIIRDIKKSSIGILFKQSINYCVF